MSCKTCDPVDLIFLSTPDVPQDDYVFQSHFEEIRLLNSDQLTSGPSIPQSLVVDAVGETTVDLNWDDTVTPSDSYTVYVYNNTTDTLEQTITGIILSEADVVGLTTDDEYEFWVTAVKNGIESTESNHVTATPIDTTSPSAPTNLVATAGDSVVDLDWDDNSETDLAYYKVYQNGVEVATNVLSSNYQVTGLTNGVEYTFEVTAVDDSDNESAKSNAVNATPVSAGVERNISSMSFDGSNDFVEASKYDGLTSLTLSCVVKLNSIPASGEFFGICGQGYLSGLEGFGLFVRDTGVLAFHTREPFDNAISVDSLNPLETGKWYWVVAVHDRGANENRLYINGELQDTVATDHTNSFETTIDQFLIGASPNTGGSGDERFFADAVIDEVQLWDKALSRSEIINTQGILEGSEANLIGYWNCEDRNTSQLTDLTSNSNHGTINEATYVYDGFDFDYSMRFDSDLEYISIESDYTVNAITLERWMNFSSSQDHGFPRLFKVDGGTNDIEINATDLYCRFRFNGIEVDSNNGFVIEDEWHHYAITYDLNTVRFYRDGVLFDSVNQSGSSSTITINEIGRSAISPVGNHDKVRIWNVARTASQIQQNMNRELEGDEIGLVGLWKFDNLSNLGVVVDSSPSGNNGTINGAKYSTDIVSYFQGLDFDGVDDRVNIGDGTPLLSNILSHSLVFDFRTTQTTSQGIIGEFDDAGNRVWYQLMLNSGDVEGIINFSTRDSDGNVLSAEISSPYDYTNGEWHRLVFVRTGLNTIRINIDGVEQTITYNTTASPDNYNATFQYDLYYGARNFRGAVNEPFLGQIDNFQLWGKELTEQEITDLQGTVPVGDEADLLIFHSSNEAAGATVYDQTSNGNNGTISGAVFTEQVGVKP